MPIIKCHKCGGMTNTAVCNHLYPVRKDGEANECYAKFENGRWVKGCAYNKACDIDQRLVNDLIYEGTEAA